MNARYYFVEGQEGLFLAKTKKEVLEFFGTKKVQLVRESVEGELIRDLSKLKKLKSSLEELVSKLGFFNKPSRKFTEGDLISFGRFKGIIKEVLHEGYIVLIEDKEGEQRYLPWFEVYPHKETLVSSFVEEKDKLNFSHMRLESLVHSYYFFGINMNPEYQRDLVWSLKDKEALIDSIARRIDIGRFVLRRLPFRENVPGYEIVDGKQRLSTLIEFLEDRFAYNGVFYSDLSSQQKRRFLDLGILVAEIEESVEEKEVIDLFKRINLSGVKIDKDFLKGL